MEQSDTARSWRAVDPDYSYYSFLSGGEATTGRTRPPGPPNPATIRVERFPMSCLTGPLLANAAATCEPMEILPREPNDIAVNALAEQYDG